MTAMTWVWALAAGGAALFFCAGLLAAGARRVAGVTVAAEDDRADDVDVPTTNLQDGLLQRVLFAEADARATRLELEQQVALLSEREAESERQRAEQQALVREREREIAELGATLEGERTRARVHVGERDGQRESEHGRQLAELRAAVERAREEALRGQEELASWKARAAAAPDADELAALRHDLTVAREQTRARDVSLERAMEDGAAQAAALREIEPLRAELTRLKQENNEIRLRALRGGGPVRVGAPAAARPLMAGGMPVVVPSSLSASPGPALQALVDDLTRRSRVRAAVVADELGLVVVSSGESGDELAAAGVVIAHAGAQAGQLLPVGRLRRVSMQDEHDLTITVSPLAAADGELSLVTLTLEESTAAAEQKPS